jgi:hypothetical protein
MTKTEQQRAKRSPYLVAHDAWVKEYYGQLIGATVAGVGLGADLCPIIIFQTAGGDRIHTRVTSDDLGDRPGYLQGLPPVKRGSP